MKFKLIIDDTKEEEVVVTAHRRSALTDRLEELTLQTREDGRIAAFGEEVWKMLSFEEIECFTVLDGKTFVIDAKGEQYRVRQRLYELEKSLPEWFIRINKSSLANERRLEKYALGFGGAVDAVFKSGHREYVSRRCFAEIKRRLDE
ncbi:MAG: LytTR family transcriptional regulator [Clostridia bacterium]|nr:LytTR family transcriptional regulator [Clostridia bacterium]